MNSDESRWALRTPRAITVDGDRVAYRFAGEGPVLLLGQGQSDKPRGKHPVGTHANTLCDLVDSSGLGRKVTFYLRMLTLPGFESVFPLFCTRRLRDVGGLVEIFDGVGHYPHCEAPERFVEVLVDFITSTEAARLPPRVASARAPSERV
jgi:hypothetical protein